MPNSNSVRRSWVIVAIWLLLSAPAVLAQTFTGAMSGTWWNPVRDGEGQYIGFERIGNRNVAVLAYFTYDAEGNARWLVGSVDFAAGATRVTIPLIQAQGASFGVGFRSSDVTTISAGAATLDYLACDRIRFSYESEDGAFGFELSRLVGPLDGADCHTRNDNSNTDRFLGTQSGSWWDPQRSGEGMFIAFERQGERRVAVMFYFSYDDAGRSRWLIGGAEHAAGVERIEIPLASSSGARFGSAFDSADVERVPAGRAMLESTGCAGLRFRYTGRVTFGLDLRRAVGELLDLPCTLAATPPSQLDAQLRALVTREGLRGDPGIDRDLPGIDAPLAQLGKLLFFSKSLGGDGDAACASCHHPALGGGDGLALPIGVAALDADMLGPGRRQAHGGLLVGRNAPTFFNTGLYDSGLFWDSRVESLGRLAGRNGTGSGIRTPDSAAGSADPSAGGNLVAAQARFPVVSPAEMLGTAFPGMTDAEVRTQLAARLGDYGSGAGRLPPSQWLARFREVFDSKASADALITFDNIALAIGEYQRSAVFVESPWSRYVRGDNAAISDSAKLGALVFFRRVDEGGAQCVKCHGGDFFTDESHHVIALPQVGPGAGDPESGDFGRARASGAGADQFAFRTPSLLNVELTAPYGHAGAYRDLETVVEHYLLPAETVSNTILSRMWCVLPPFNADPGCASMADAVSVNTGAALARLQALRASGSPIALPVIDPSRVGGEMVPHMVEFLRSLTDPCLRDRGCYGRWIPDADDAPDGLQLNATDAMGNPL
jgi:cytochrome c peroxidase